MNSNHRNDIENENREEPERLGWIGTGVMGKPMCRHLITAGYQLAIYTRTKAKAHALLDQGAIWCENPKQVALRSEVIFTIVGFPHDVEAVYFGEEGIFAGLHPKSILIDMTTSQPALAQRIAERAAQQQCEALDAPVSGGDVGAREGTLAIMVGGKRPIFEKTQVYLHYLGKNIQYMGPAGSGQHTKMCNQILIASTMIGVVESLLYAYRSGLAMEEVIDVIGKGAAASWSINNLGRRITQHNFDPGFFIKHFVKDMGIALEEAKRLHLALPGLALAYQFYESAMAQGWEELGTQGLFHVLAKLNGMQEGDY